MDRFCDSQSPAILILSGTALLGPLSGMVGRCYIYGSRHTFVFLACLCFSFRVIHLTRLPAEVIEYSENLQVVQYDQGGYYHAHWDSEDGFSEVGCGHTKLSESIYMAAESATCR